MPSFPFNPNLDMIPSIPNNFDSTLRPYLNNEKQNDYGVYVTNLEKIITKQLLYFHFSKVKPIQYIKLPMNDFQQNKSFAFIYFKSKDDAEIARQKLNRSVILKNKIRVTKVSNQQSNLMIHLKNNKKLTSEQIRNIKEKYFNEQVLEKQIQKIIQEYFKKSVLVNLITMGLSKQKQPLNYARLYLIIDLKTAEQIANRIQDRALVHNKKLKQEAILDIIISLLRKDTQFDQYCLVSSFNSNMMKETNVVHIKGISLKEDQTIEQLSDQLKQFILNIEKQSQVLNCYVKNEPQFGCWSNVTFKDHEMAKKFYQKMKNQNVLFRNSIKLFCTRKNYTEQRIILASVVADGVTQPMVKLYLDQIAKKHPSKYFYYSFHINERKHFYLTDQDTIVIINDLKIKEYIQENPSFRFIKTIPRRLIIYYEKDIKKTKYQNILAELIRQMTENEQYKTIFITEQKKKDLKPNSIKGHFQVVYDQSIFYVRHLNSRLKNTKETKVPIDRQQHRKQKLVTVPAFDIKNIQKNNPIPNIYEKISPTFIGSQVGGGAFSHQFNLPNQRGTANYQKNMLNMQPMVQQISSQNPMGSLNIQNPAMYTQNQNKPIMGLKLNPNTQIPKNK